MTMETIHFDDTCTIECTRNGQKVKADILNFRENQFLSVVFQKTVKEVKRIDPKSGKSMIFNAETKEFIRYEDE